MKKSEKNKMNFIWWLVAGSVLLPVGVISLTLGVNRVLSFTILGLSFVLNLIAVIKAMAQREASGAHNSERQKP